MESISQREIDLVWANADASRSENKKCPITFTRDLALILFSEVETLWKKYIYKEWIPSMRPNHYCNVSTFKQGSSGAGVDDCHLKMVHFRLYMTSNGEYHPCVQPLCSTMCSEQEEEMLHKEFIRQYRELYMCTYTGKAHYCGEYCSITNPTHWDADEFDYYHKHMYNRDGTLICPLTGYCSNTQRGLELEEGDLTYDKMEAIKMQNQYDDNCKEAMTINEYKAQKAVKQGGFTYEIYDEELDRKLHKNDFHVEKLDGSLKYSQVVQAYGKYNRKKLRGMYVLTMEELRPVLMDVVTHKIQDIDSTLRNVRRERYQAIKEFYLIYAAIKIANMLSTDKSKPQVDSQKGANLKNFRIFNVYINHCESKGLIPNVCELLEIIKTEDRTMVTTASYEMDPEFLVQTSLDYGKLMVQAWYGLVVNSNLMEEDPCSLKFPYFVETFAHFLTNGYYMRMPDGKVVQIYAKENIFAATMSLDIEERNKGDYAKKRKRKKIALIKKNIQIALTQSIIEKKQPYSVVVPHAYEYDMLDDKYFIDFKEWKEMHPKSRRQQHMIQLHNPLATANTPGMQLNKNIATKREGVVKRVMTEIDIGKMKRPRTSKDPVDIEEVNAFP